MANSTDRRQSGGSDVDPRLFKDEPLPVKGWVVAHCDGGSRGNPGPSGFGVLIQDKNGLVLAELSEFLGKRTNNYAEYSALLAALNFAVEQGHPRLRVISDSELMVKQIKGQYRVNSPELKPLHEEARHRIALLEGFEIQHVLREKNRKADELANLAMDRGMGRASETPAIQKRSARLEGKGISLAPPIPISRSGESAPPLLPAPVLIDRRAPVFRGFVKDGVVHLLDSAQLPDGAFVKITLEK
ncbi:MAG TPA: ribonuclease HI family protein [Acidisarcina sp.]